MSDWFQTEGVKKMKTIKVQVRYNKRHATFEIVVNNRVLCERPHPKYANGKAEAFAKYAIKAGMNVELTLTQKAA